DVGSGSGKFCLIGAAATGARFTGIEHREKLVWTARTAAVRLGAEGARFLHGTFDSVDVSNFDGFYFFNPFGENLWSEEHFDETVELSHDRFTADIERAEMLLTRARVGTRVVTYHGFGGEMPSGYRRTLREPWYRDYL